MEAPCVCVVHIAEDQVCDQSQQVTDTHTEPMSEAHSATKNSQNVFTL